MLDAQFTLVESNDDVQAFFSWLGERRTWLAIDTETGGFDWWRNRLRLVQFGDAEHGWSIPWDQYAGVIKEAISGYRGAIVFHNIKFDLHFLEHNGVKVPRQLCYDTFAMAHVVSPNLRAGLKAVSERLITRAATIGAKELKAVMNKGKWNWDTIPVQVPEYWQYAALDVILTARIAEILWEEIHKLNLSEVYNIEVAVAMALKDMENRGMQIDIAFCREQAAQISEYEKMMEQWFFDQYGITKPGSTKQVADTLMAQGVALTERTPTGKYKMDEETLRSIKHPMVSYLLEYRDWAKIKSTYFDGFVEFSQDGILHTSINPLGARTGRMSSSRPNLQNVPRSWVRNAFIARPGHKLILVDYDQIELRLMAHYAGVTEMIEAVLRGEDLHTLVGKLVYNTPSITKAQRQIVKNANFAKIYGAGAAKFANTAGITIDDARQFMAMYDARFPTIKKFILDLSAKGRDQGFVVTPYIGRRQVLDDREYAYKIVNYFVQGTAADVLKKKLVELSMTPSFQFAQLTIHDEIAFDVPEEYVPYVREEVPQVLNEMEAFSVPLTTGVEVVDRWGDKYAS